MLKSPLTIYFCSSFFLLPITHDESTREIPLSKFNIADKAPFALSKAPKAPLNKQGMLFVKNYIKKSNSTLVTIKHRSAIPFNIIDSVFRHYGLPVELKYLAVIESELKSSAASHVGAVGPWQLMPGTAHILGLQVNRKYDDRKNYYKSTKAAARYLKDLYAEFGDWLLVLAAYNGGPGPVYTAINKSGSKNFWALQRYLPAESRNHVKKFIATHYYFEGRGSLTTLTKQESIRYTKLVNAFAASSATAEPLKPIAQQKQETDEEKFQRLMTESGKSLAGSSKLLNKN